MQVPSVEQQPVSHVVASQIHGVQAERHSITARKPRRAGIELFVAGGGRHFEVFRQKREEDVSSLRVGRARAVDARAAVTATTVTATRFASPSNFFALWGLVGLLGRHHEHDLSLWVAHLGPSRVLGECPVELSGTNQRGYVVGGHGDAHRRREGGPRSDTDDFPRHGHYREHHRCGKPRH